MAHFLGIDPGQNGALVKIDAAQNLVNCLSFTLNGDQWSQHLAFMLKKETEATGIVLELVHAMPKQGVSSMFKFGENFGIIKGILVAFSLPYTLMRPQAWQKKVWSPMTEGLAAKERSLHAAVERWGEQPFRRSPRCKKLDSGLIDAALMAEAGRLEWVESMNFEAGVSA